MKRLPTSRLLRNLLSTVSATLFCIRCHGAAGDDQWETSIGNPGTGTGAVYDVFTIGEAIYVGGSFLEIGGIPANGIAKHASGGWTALGGGVTEGGFPAVLRLAAYAGKIYVGGAFARAGEVAANNIARWDGTNWFPCGAGVGGIVRAFAVYGDKLVVGGSFSSAGGIPVSNIALWDGTNWSALGSGVTWPYSGPAVDCLAVDGTNLYAAGRFRTAGGVAATNVARWNGTFWSALGKGLRHNNGPDWSGNGIVRAMVANQGMLVAGGELSKAGDVSVTNIARWDGTNWTSMGGIGAVEALAANGSTIFAGGWFIDYNHIAEWSGTRWVGMGSGIGGGPEGGAVWGLAANGSELFVGGPFGTAGGKPANNIATWHVPHALSVTRTAETVTLSWPATGTNFVLEAKESLANTNWTLLLTQHAIEGGQCRVTNEIDSPTRFFRLRRR